ncbi:MAG: aspartate ammonia-lyase [Elusimicrobia bacterium]|nr:aspartate ammonia-lyase [Elusimicrobiota bacterium]
MRTEKDSLGPFKVPADAYYGVQTARAAANFPVSGLRAHPSLVSAYAAIKKACALTNRELGVLDASLASPIIKACDELLEELKRGGAGPLSSQFIVDVYQAGAGTSFNMNANEVVANRALELLGKRKGDYAALHPNDHVNMSQSTNDTYPTATHAAALLQIRRLLPAMRDLERSFAAKGKEFARVIKSARTHLQDAVPITLGQEFSAYAAALGACSRELERRATLLHAVALGGTAAGTGVNAPPGFRAKAVAHLAKILGLPLVPAEDPRMALQSHLPLLAVSGALRDSALELIRIANDLRLMCSGPMTGFGEIVLPAVQPGSSIMPGKVNPSLLECLDMVCFQIVGRDAAIGLAAQAGQMDLNVMTPLTAYNLLDSIQLLINFLPKVDKSCVRGIKADVEKNADFFGKSLSLAALLNPRIGYAKAAEVFKEALARRITVRDVILEKRLLTEKQLDALFDPRAVTGFLDR